MAEATPIEMEAVPSSPTSSASKKVNVILQDAVPQKEYVYDFMRSDTYPVSGLQDWPERMWSKQIWNCPILAVPFVEDFFQNGEMNDADIKTTRDVAKTIKEAMNHPLLEKQWLAVLRFQNGLKHTPPWTERDWRIALGERRGEALADRLVEELGMDDGGLVARESVDRRRSFEMMKENVDCSVSTWKAMYEFQTQGQQHFVPLPYLDHMLRSHVLFDREFPLGVEDHVLSEATRNQFVLKHSGLTSVNHTENKLVSLALYGMIIGLTFVLVIWLIVATQSDEWDIEATMTNLTNTNAGQEVISRTKNRAFVASMFSTLAFSLTVNASIDKFGKIDPSTSTVLVGMTVGNTFGFVLDNMIGSDEGFREYLWSTTGGMAYAIGSLGTDRYARYIVTILFDMFFTVILFKRLYSVIVRLAGFSAAGREWIANGMASTIISTLTFQVYANMTRLQWAYPSGNNGAGSNWISGSTMVLAVVTMNIVYLIDETRSSVGERGINDPPVKIVVTLCTFILLAGLQQFNSIDPAVTSGGATSIDTSAFMDHHLRLKGVCETLETFPRGFGIFVAIVICCFAFVIFVTSAQTMSGLKEACPCGKSAPEAESKPQEGSLKVKFILFTLYVSVVFAIVLFFTVVPLWSHRGEIRNVADCP